MRRRAELPRPFGIECDLGVIIKIVTAHANDRATLHQLGILAHSQRISYIHLEPLIDGVIHPDVTLMRVIQRIDSVLRPLQVVIHPERITHTNVSLLK